MRGLRAYDVFMAGVQIPQAEIDAAKLAEYRDRFSGVPVFLADDAQSCYKETVDANGGRIDIRTLPPVTVPFQRFCVEWQNHSEPADLWERVLCLCSHYKNGLFQVLVFACGLPLGVPVTILDAEFRIWIPPDGTLGPIELFAARDGMPPEAKETTPSILGCALFTLGLLSAKNVQRVEGLPPRHIRRHPGNFVATVGHSHYTLDIPGAREFNRAVAGAGEAQRKRMHIVRGHFADYTEGGGLFGKLHGRYYIAPHVRGSAAIGTITKDYRVRGAA